MERQLRAAAGVQAAVDAGLLPLYVMLRRMRGDTSITDEQFQAAVAAAPYVHPKLAAVAVREQTDDVSHLSDAELHAVLVRTLKQDGLFGTLVKDVHRPDRSYSRAAGIPASSPQPSIQERAQRPRDLPGVVDHLPADQVREVETCWAAQT